MVNAIPAITINSEPSLDLGSYDVGDIITLDYNTTISDATSMTTIFSVTYPEDLLSVSTFEATLDGADITSNYTVNADEGVTYTGELNAISGTILASVRLLATSSGDAQTISWSNYFMAFQDPPFPPTLLDSDQNATFSVNALSLGLNLSRPLDSAILSTTSPIFIWETVPGASYYTLTVEEDVEGIIYATNVTRKFKRIPINLESPSFYNWSVSAFSSNHDLLGTSSSRDFSVDAQNETILLSVVNQDGTLRRGIAVRIDGSPIRTPKRVVLTKGYHRIATQKKFPVEGGDMVFLRWELGNGDIVRRRSTFNYLVSRKVSLKAVYRFIPSL